LDRAPLVTEPTKPLPADKRPFDPTPVHTEDLPPTPIRDRNIPASAWIEAPAALLDAGEDIGQDKIAYKRRLGPWLLWRAGPAKGEHSRYIAIDHRDLARIHTLDLYPDNTASGVGPSGATHARFRAWKEDLNATE
jgi:hypothetical protein